MAAFTWTGETGLRSLIALLHSRATKTTFSKIQCSHTSIFITTVLQYFGPFPSTKMGKGAT